MTKDRSCLALLRRIAMILIVAALGWGCSEESSSSTTTSPPPPPPPPPARAELVVVPNGGGAYRVWQDTATICVSNGTCFTSLNTRAMATCGDSTLHPATIKYFKPLYRTATVCSLTNHWKVVLDADVGSGEFLFTSSSSNSFQAARSSDGVMVKTPFDQINEVYLP